MRKGIKKLALITTSILGLSGLAGNAHSKEIEKEDFLSAPAEKVRVMHSFTQERADFIKGFFEKNPDLPATMHHIGEDIYEIHAPVSDLRECFQAAALYTQFSVKGPENYHKFSCEDKGEGIVFGDVNGNGHFYEKTFRIKDSLKNKLSS